MRSSLALSFLLLAPSAPAQDCTGDSVGLVPLNDLAGGSYQGFEGGLYPGGANDVPAAHLAAGLVEAAQVVPRDAGGAPAADGRIGFLSIGMSNTRLHFADFVARAANDPLRDPRVRVVNTAQGGVPAEDMSDPNDPYWDFVDDTVAAAGLSPAQVQVIWMLQANRQPTLSFPEHALVLQGQMTVILGIVRDRFPNARLAFLGARIYAGYAVTTLNPEPYAYEQAFADKGLIAAQIGGAPELNYDPGVGPVEAPWLAWGPYMWADGLVPRSDGLVWECGDYQADGTHPNAQGAAKVGGALLEFVHASPLAAWYLGDPGCGWQTYCTAAEGHPHNVAGIEINGCTLDSGRKVRLSGGPPGQTAYLLIGDGSDVIATPPGASGDLCLAGGSCLGRYALDVGTIDGAGHLVTDIESSASGGAGFGIPTCGGAIHSGETWNFQYWHRMPMGAPSTFSAALAVTFE